MINPAFFKTLDQAISKYLNVKPQRLRLLHHEDKEFDSILNPPRDTGFCLKRAIVNYIEISTQKGMSVDLENLKLGLIEMFGDKLFKDETVGASMAEK